MKTALAAYAKTHTSSLSGPILESEALVKAAHLLEKARARTNDPVALGEALRFNLKLWTLFQADLSDKENALPEDLKAQLLSLSLFMDKSTARLIEGHDTETLQAMIDVNRTLAFSS